MASSLLASGLRFTTVAALTTALVFTASPYRSLRAQSGSSAYEGSLDDQTTYAIYPVSLGAGEAILVTMQATSGTLDTYLELYEGDHLLTGNDDRELNVISDSAMGYLSRDGGEYTIRASRLPGSGSGGTYLLQIQTGDTDLLLELNELVPRVEFSGEVSLYETEHFLIHYTTSGSDAATEEFVEATAETAEAVFRIEIEEMGWVKPPEDGGMGGDDRYDIYLTDLLGSGQEVFGMAETEFVVGDNLNSEPVETSASTSFFRMDNDFADTDKDPATAMRATLAHEYHHSVQFGYDQAEPANWLFEATATWMETTATPDDQDATGYVEYAYSYPELCLGFVSEDDSQLQYGQWTFMENMAQMYGPNTVQELWDILRDEDSFTGIASLLQQYDTTVPELAASYRLRDLARDYDLAPSFEATVFLENGIEEEGTYTFNGQGVQELGANYYAFAPELGVYNAALANDQGGLELWAVGINSDEGTVDAFLLGSGGMFDTSSYDEFYLMVFNPNYDDEVADCSYYDYEIEVTAAEEDGNLAEPTLQYDARYFETLG